MAACSGIVEYELSSSGTSRIPLDPSIASLDTYMEPLGNIKIKLDTTNLAPTTPLKFYIWGRDYEPRWTEEAVSDMIQFYVICGSEDISVT